MASYTISPIWGAGAQLFDNSGNVLTGGKIYTYLAGTTTPATTYTTATGSTANSNPIVANAAGRLTNEIWLPIQYSYKFVLKDANDVLLATYDNIPTLPQPAIVNDASSIAYEQGYTVTAGNFTIGETYLITSIGSTDFTAIGATANTTGIHFVATGVGSGTGTAEYSRTVQSKLQESVSVKDFGAVGDGVTNDTAAFVAASAYITAQDGGKLIIPAGTYIVGSQTFAGATGKGYSYLASDIIAISNCTNPVIIEGNGATLKAASGLKFGSFDPVTGAVYNPGSLPFNNYDYRAHADSGMIQLNGNTNVTVSDLSLDGNIQNLTLGGYWGDTGRQCYANGIYAYGNSNLTVNNVYTHHHGLDGVIIGYTGLTETSDSYPHTLTNIVSEYNARQGLSWVGGTNLSAIDCKFNNTGKSTFGSAPQAGVDIEAESSVCRNGSFINCEFSNNTGVGMLATSGDSADVDFIRCRFIGQSNWTIWPSKPRLSFSDCTIVGAYVNSYYSTTVPSDTTKYFRCLFTDEAKYAATLYNIGSLGSLLSFSSTQTNVVYDTCSFIATRSKAGRFDASILKDCTFNIQAGTTYCVNQDWFMIVWGATLSNVVITDNITVNPPADAFYVGTNNTEKFININNLISSGKLKWTSWSAAASGFTGTYGLTYPNALNVTYLAVNKDFWYNAYKGFVRIYAASAAPVGGTWAVGDRVLNQAPAVGQPKGWICTVAGTPGTWVSEGNL